MSSTVFLGNLPAWVTADDIKSWLVAENLVADSVKVIRNPETQESKGFAFIEAPNEEEMNSIIKRFDRAPLEERLLRANPAQPPRGRSQARPVGPTPGQQQVPISSAPAAVASAPAQAFDKRRGGRKHRKPGGMGPQSAFAEELAKAL
jgi:RNA recognition motif-containing protein